MPQQGVFNEYLQIRFLRRNKKKSLQFGVKKKLKKAAVDYDIVTCFSEKSSTIAEQRFCNTEILDRLRKGEVYFQPFCQPCSKTSFNRNIAPDQEFFQLKYVYTVDSRYLEFQGTL